MTVLTGAESAELSVNCEVNAQELQANAGQVDLKLTVTEEKMVNKRAHQNDLLVPFDTLTALAVRLMDEQPGVLVCVDDQTPTEVAPETTLDKLVGEDIKGVLTDHVFYAPEQLASVRADSLTSGMIHTLKNEHCMVHETGEELLRLRQKSCGKCIFCREGLYQLSQVMQDVSEGRAKAGNLALAEEIGSAMTVSCNCTLGECSTACAVRAQVLWPRGGNPLQEQAVPGRCVLVTDTDLYRPDAVQGQRRMRSCLPRAVHSSERWLCVGH